MNLNCMFTIDNYSVLQEIHKRYELYDISYQLSNFSTKPNLRCLRMQYMELLSFAKRVDIYCNYT